MPVTGLQSQRLLPFVKAKTTPDMTKIAKLLAEIKVDVIEMLKARKTIGMVVDDKKIYQAMTNLVYGGADAGMKADEAIDLLRSIRTRIEDYLKQVENQNAVN